MSEVMTRRALAVSFGEVKAGKIVEVKTVNIVEANSANERVLCDECGSDKVHRIFRKGFLQKRFIRCSASIPGGASSAACV